MLANWKPGQPLPDGCDPFHPAVTVDELFGGSLSGAALLDSILELYGDGLVDLDWYTDTPDGENVRAMVRSPLSRNIQEGTVQAYMRKIIDDGLSQAVSGHGVFWGFPGCNEFSMDILIKDYSRL